MKKYIILFCLLLIGSLPAASVVISDKSFIKLTSYKEVNFSTSKYKRLPDGIILITTDDKSWIDMRALVVDGYKFDSFQFNFHHSLGLHGTQSLTIFLKK